MSLSDAYINSLVASLSSSSIKDIISACCDLWDVSTSNIISQQVFSSVRTILLNLLFKKHELVFECDEEEARFSEVILGAFANLFSSTKSDEFWSNTTNPIFHSLLQDLFIDCFVKSSNSSQWLSALNESMRVLVAATASPFANQYCDWILQVKKMSNDNNSSSIFDMVIFILENTRNSQMLHYCTRLIYHILYTNLEKVLELHNLLSLISVHTLVFAEAVKDQETEETLDYLFRCLESLILDSSSFTTAIKLDEPITLNLSQALMTIISDPLSHSKELCNSSYILLSHLTRTMKQIVNWLPLVKSCSKFWPQLLKHMSLLFENLASLNALQFNEEKSDQIVASVGILNVILYQQCIALEEEKEKGANEASIDCDANEKNICLLADLEKLDKEIATIVCKNNQDQHDEQYKPWIKTMLIQTRTYVETFKGKITRGKLDFPPTC